MACIQAAPRLPRLRLPEVRLAITAGRGAFGAKGGQIGRRQGG